jgi:putative transposase
VTAGCSRRSGRARSLHDINVRLWAFLDEHYHKAAHASLMGRSPAAVYETAERPVDRFDEQKLRLALTVRVRRRVRRDSTLPLDGADWELDHGFLAGRLVTVGRCLVDTTEPPWIEHEGKQLVLHPRRPHQDARRKRPPRAGSWSAPPRTPAAVNFDPPKVLLDTAVGRTPSSESSS